MKIIEILKEKVNSLKEVKEIMKDGFQIYTKELEKNGFDKKEKFLEIAQIITSTIINLGSLWVIFNMSGWIQITVLSLVIFGIVWKYIIYGGILIGYNRLIKYYKIYFKALIA